MNGIIVTRRARAERVSSHALKDGKFTFSFEDGTDYELDEAHLRRLLEAQYRSGLRVAGSEEE